jgi:hypothetical protein
MIFKNASHPSQANTVLQTDSWSALSDAQKAQALLRSERLLDADTFLAEFKSWEQPDIPSPQNI